MTATATATEPKLPTSSRSKKARSNDSCECADKKPTRVPFTNIDGFTGEYCDKCMQVLNYQKIAPLKVEKPKKPVTTGEYPVVQVLATNDPAIMEFKCSAEDKLFSIVVPSTVEKVTKALTDPTIIVGKLAAITFDKIENGIPVNPVVTAIKKPKQETK